MSHPKTGRCCHRGTRAAPAAAVSCSGRQRQVGAGSGGVMEWGLCGRDCMPVEDALHAPPATQGKTCKPTQPSGVCARRAGAAKQGPGPGGLEHHQHSKHQKEGPLAHVRAAGVCRRVGGRSRWCLPPERSPNQHTVASGTAEWGPQPHAKPRCIPTPQVQVLQQSSWELGLQVGRAMDVMVLVGSDGCA